VCNYAQSDGVGVYDGGGGVAAQFSPQLSDVYSFAGIDRASVRNED